MLTHDSFDIIFPAQNWDIWDIQAEVIFIKLIEKCHKSKQQD